MIFFPAQVVMEGFFEGAKGHIWIDNIHMSVNTPLEECTGKCEPSSSVVFVLALVSFYFRNNLRQFTTDT